MGFPSGSKQLITCDGAQTDAFARMELTALSFVLVVVIPLFELVARYFLIKIFCR